MARRVLVISLLLAILPAAPAGASRAGPVIGVGEQKPGMFHSSRWRALGLRDVRYITPWDTLKDPAQRARLDAWMTGAQAAHARVLLGFSHSLRNVRWARRLPTVKQFETQFVRFRARYPWVRDWLVWNEANNGYAMTKNKPRLVAGFFDAAARHCGGCNLIGADVLDTSNMVRWVTQFRRYARHRPRIWGLHNYVDANYFYTRGTLRLLAAVRGQIWFTETGGLVVRRVHRGRRVIRTLRYGVLHAARATSQVFRLACLSPRITRVYLYHWRGPGPKGTWDSGLLDGHGNPRPAFEVLRKWLARSAWASRRGGRRALCGAPLL
jgi:hypothetical protein